jgi:3-hydroxybutyryl-CoA dehydrogenase
MTGLSNAAVLVVGAGTMGTGIAQVAAQSGHAVHLFDAREGAAAEAKRKLGQTLDALVGKGRIGAAEARAVVGRIDIVGSLTQAGRAGLAIEAIVEQMDAKRALFAQLEDLLGDDAIIATNTSSLSITALANGMKHPGRLVGMHFFNPVALMKLVEVISGLQTAPEAADQVFDLARAWGKVPVRARSTPGFIVNRIARPFYAEALMLLHERAVDPHVLDACLRAAGFRMGPCELMDLIGHDVNFAVTRSVFEANFFDKRYAPSLVQQELVDGGLLGRKTGRGFYRYPDGAPPLPAAACDPIAPAQEVVVHGDDAIAGAIADKLKPILGREVPRGRTSGWIGLALDGARLVLTDGRTASELGAALGATDVAVFDRPLDLSGTAKKTLAYALHPRASPAWRAQAPAWLGALGFAPQQVADSPGLVVARTVAMLINEASDAVLQGVCTEEGANAAMRLGVNYPAGPFEWMQAWSVEGVIAVIDALDRAYRGERYRTSRWLATARDASPGQR